MSTKFLSGGSSQPEPPVLEAQQALLLRALRRARGEPVGYDQLREAGIQFPASIVAELELAGIPIERCQSGGGRTAVGVRLRTDELDPELQRALEPEGPRAPKQPRLPAGSPEPEPRPAHREPAPLGVVPVKAHSEPDCAPGPPPDWSPVRVYRTPPTSVLARAGAELALSAGAAVRDAARTRNRRVLVPLALLAAVGIVLGLVLAVPGGGAAHPKAAATRRPAQIHRLVAAAHRTAHTRTTSRAATTRQTSTTATSTVTTTPPPTTTTTASTSTPVSHALATSLESQGHTLLQSGQYAGAVPILRRAVAATGESTSGCAEPMSSTCLTYAYALYDLGRALRLSGNSAAAVPILEARLQIDNQRPTVAAELQLARAKAG